MKIREITNYLESIAPLNYQEKYDNSGLLIGSKDDNLKGILITLDCTEEVVDEALRNDCNLIISHHPLIFKGLKKINECSSVERVVTSCIRKNICVYALHTNLDNIYNGVNHRIAKKIGLVETKILLPKKDILRKLAVYCPLNHSDKLKNALFVAGAGNLGNYEKCSFSSLGKGTFFPKKEANPYSGKIAELNIEKEEKIEVIYPLQIENKVLLAMLNSHPYEEVSYQIYNLANTYNQVGSGLLGQLKSPINSFDFILELKKNMNTIPFLIQ